MTSKKAAGVVISCNNSVILCKRILQYKGQKVPYGGYWSPFAGIIEEGESPKDTAVRELKEESQVEANKQDLKHLNTFKNKSTHFYLYLLEVEDFPQIKLCQEHTDIGYFNVELLKELPEEYKIDSRILKSIQDYKK
jgi:ADP-ribose pyrophosphatase YjhB (NUDIX family)